MKSFREQQLCSAECSYQRRLKNSRRCYYNQKTRSRQVENLKCPNRRFWVMVQVSRFPKKMQMTLSPWPVLMR